MTRQGSVIIAPPGVTNSDTGIASAGSLVGADGNSNFLGVAAMLYDEVSARWQRQRNNISGTAIAQTADSIATVTGSDITSHNGRLLRLIITFADKQGTVTFTPKLQGKTAGGTYYDSWTAAAAVSANSVVVYDISPYAVSTANGVTESKIAQVPRVFRVVLTYSGAGAGNSFDILGEYELGV